MLHLFTILTIVGCLSPLLTFLALFQQKEWRLDRLMEHLEREGFVFQLWGRIRPILAGLLFLTDSFGIGMVMGAESKEALIRVFGVISILHLGWLIVFALLSIAQIFLRKQRMPVWTNKALMMTATAFLLLFFFVELTAPLLIFAAVALLIQPAIAILAWVILLPVDKHLKTKTYTRAQHVREELKDAIVIGIAGSVGKTTTKELIKHLLTDLHPIATPAHVNTEMGVAQWMIGGRSETPLHLQATEGQVGDRRSGVWIVEMGAYKKGEIALMCSFVQPTIGVMTALGSDHVALFGSEEAIVEGNAELLHALPQSGHAFLYADNDAVQSLVPGLDCHVTLAGQHTDADIRAEKIEETDTGLRLSIHGLSSTIRLHGLHNIGNILLAVAIAKHLHISDARIHELLESFEPLAHTFTVRTEHGIKVVDDTYNSSRLSIRAALDWASTQKERPRILLMSGLLETGDQEDVFLKELGAAAKDSVERVIFTSDTGRKSFEAAYGKPIEILSKNTDSAASGSLLLCLGRMPVSSIQKLLPEFPVTDNR